MENRLEVSLAFQIFDLRKHQFLTKYLLIVNQRKKAQTIKSGPFFNLQYTGGRGRTDTPVKERDFESRASANSATPASNDLADKNYYSTSYFMRQYFINITEKIFT